MGPIVEEIWSALVPGVGPVENEDKCSEDPRKIFRDDAMRLSLITIRIFEHRTYCGGGSIRGHGRARPRARTASDEYPRPRWWRTASARFAAHFPVPPARLRRQRICREKVTTATLIAVEIVRKNPDQVGFAVNPRRWVVERLFAWIGRNRRLAKDFEATIDSARAFLYAASVMLLVRRLSSFMTFETDFKVNNSLTTDRTVPNMQRLQAISMRQTKDFLQPQKRTPTEKMFKDLGNARSASGV